MWLFLHRNHVTRMPIGALRFRHRWCGRPSSLCRLQWWLHHPSCRWEKPLHGTNDLVERERFAQKICHAKLAGLLF